MDVKFRRYDPERDHDAVCRIWKEVGWLKDEEQAKQAFELFLEANRGHVVELQGEAECAAFSAPGDLRYLDVDLPFAAITGVTTGRVARKQGLAGRLTAQRIAADVAEGALVSALGIFEQGFYDRLGFGNGGYEHWLQFDPAQLQVDARHRVPRRITAEDWEAVHAARLARRTSHGRINLHPPKLTQAEMRWAKHGFGLGYFDGDDGELTHYLWINHSDREHGPYNVWWVAYRTGEEFLELLALLKSLGDQVRMVSLQEPPGIQLQDFLKQPFRFRQLTEKSKYENRMSATSYWQARINDVPACLARTRLPVAEAVRFNLVLIDPIELFLEPERPWRGVSGEYVVTLGSDSGAQRGRDPALPTLRASVNAFTRLWLGVRPATGLAITTDLAGPGELLAQLERVLCLPSPKPDWDF